MILRPFQAWPWVIYMALLAATLLFSVGAEKFEITEEDKNYWAFGPVSRDGAATIDSIIDADLLVKGLIANGPSSREQLIRRAYFDLVGFAPTYKEIQSFVEDPIPTNKAFSKLIDRLLAMTEYGERWGRHWLDVVRYAQTNGYERDDEKPNAWRYRDYVIDAFNSDKPYDRFVLEQLAGDELMDGGDAGLIATGFYRLGVWDDEPDNKSEAEFDGLDDILRTTSETFIGLTAGCARCHDHMFDPISQTDYYEMLAFFRNVRSYQKPGDKGIILRPVQGGKALSISEHGNKAADTHVLIRGEVAQPAQKVEPRVPDIFSTRAPEAVPTKDSSGRRLAFARWVVDPDNPLTARVMVNRIWQYHFGRGIVATPNDFGRAGNPVSNTELLDWLADEFVASSWSVKHMHRVIMKTRAYRRSSKPDAENDAKDPGNIHHWRANMRRLEAETLRDRILQVSGALNKKRGGQSFYPALSGEVVAGASKPGRGWGWSKETEQKRRSVYAFVKRNMVYPFFEIFDYANTEGSLGIRPQTTVAPQALLMLNSELVADSSALIAERIQDKDDSVLEAFRVVLGRDPEPHERSMAAAFLKKQEQEQKVLVNQLRFRPDFPPALFKDFQAALPSSRFLRGPSAGWDYFKGKWTGGYEGILNAESDWPPFTLFKMDSNDSKVSGRIKLDSITEKVAILLRSSPRGDDFDGYALLLDAVSNEVSIRRHFSGKIETLTTLSTGDLRRGFLDFVATLKASDIEFEVGGMKLSVKDTKPIAGIGRVGVSAWGGSVIFEGLKINVDGNAYPVTDINYEKSELYLNEKPQKDPAPDGWSAYGGNWMVGREIISIAKERGPKLLWNSVGELSDGDFFKGELRVTDGDIAGFILNVREPKTGANNWIGYEVSLYMNEQKLVLGTHQNDWKSLASVAAPIKRDTWHKLEVQTVGDRVKIYFDGRPEPYIDHRMKDPLSSGLAGLRTWGAKVDYRKLSVVRGEKKTDYVPEGNRSLIPKNRKVILSKDPNLSRNRALAEFCSLLLNLNEFVYVD